ncbi:MULTISPECIES: DUF5133 domain-containing protein [unclassified Streptomyces]|uniref:DUF5133 domain-containing protein n=1 Tax=unclassified Streptomyces TaxID=2593676 RepID=UPI0036FAC631
MLMAHPVVLRELVEQYEALQALQAEKGGAEARRRMDDLAYTLCVSTGTRDVDAALIAARRRLPETRAEEGPALTA